jgi:predicted alpha/beta hydrolase family esterase
MPPDVSRPGADPRLSRFTSCPRQRLPFRSFLAAGSRLPTSMQKSLRALAADWDSAFVADEFLGTGGLVDGPRDWPSGRSLLGHLLHVIPAPFARADDRGAESALARDGTAS